MSPEAVDRRLREASELHRLGLSILASRKTGKVAEVEPGPDVRQPEASAPGGSRP